MRGLFALGSVVLGAGCITGCDGPSGPYFGHVPDPDPTHLTLCGLSDPETLDPARAAPAPDHKVVYELFDGLTTFDPRGLPLPSLATSWETSPDLTRFTFHLRPDARWSNGRPLVAEDFLYSFARVLHPLTAANGADVMMRVRHAKEYSAGTARLVLADASPFKAGDMVVVQGDTASDLPRSSNLRRARQATPLRAEPDGGAETWATAPAGADLIVIERRCSAGACWAYLYLGSSGDEGAYGWAPLADLDAPNDDTLYPVSAGDRRGTVRGKDLLMLPEVLGASAPDPHTLVLETDGPTPSLLDVTLQRSFRPVPREAVSRWPRTWTAPGHIVSSGPFQLAAQRAHDKIELTRSPTFWGAAGVRLSRVTFLIVESQSVAANIYYQGGCDALVANALPMSYVDVVSGKKDFHVAPYLGISTLVMNTQRLANVHLRRSLELAIDRNAFIRILGYVKGPAEQYVPGTPVEDLTPAERALCKLGPDARGVALIVEKDRACYVPPFAPAFDAEAARRELAQARSELGAAMPEHITYMYNYGTVQHRLVAEYLRSQWNTVLGLDVEIKVVDWKSLLAALRDGRYDLARLGWLGGLPDPETEYLSMFKCGSPANEMRYCNSEVDRLLALAAVEPDRQKRLGFVAQVEQIVVDDAPIVPLYRFLQDHLQKPYVRDLYINLTDNQSLRATWIDASWRSR